MRLISIGVVYPLHHSFRVHTSAPASAATPIIPAGIIPQTAGPSRQQPPAPPTVTQVVQNPEAFQTQLSQTMQAVEPPGTSFTYQTYQAQLPPATRTMHPSPAAPPQTWQAPNSIAPEQTQGHLPQQIIQPRGPYREDTWDPTYQPTGPPTGPIDHPSAPGYDYPDQAWSSDQYFAQGVCALFVISYNIQITACSTTQLLIRNRIYLRVAHRMNHHRQLPRAPIHHVGANVPELRSIYGFLLSTSADTA